MGTQELTQNNARILVIEIRTFPLIRNPFLPKNTLRKIFYFNTIIVMNFFLITGTPRI